jgi:hypothetical protein
VNLQSGLRGHWIRIGSFRANTASSPAFVCGFLEGEDCKHGGVKGPWKISFFTSLSGLCPHAFFGRLHHLIPELDELGKSAHPRRFGFFFTIFILLSGKD